MSACCTLFILRQKKNKQIRRRPAAVISGVIPLCSLTLLCASHDSLNSCSSRPSRGQMSENCTSSNASIITRSEAGAGVDRITHLVRVSCLYLRDTNTSSGSRIDPGTRCTRCFIFTGSHGSYWSIAIAIPCTVGQINSFQLQLAWRPGD